VFGSVAIGWAKRRAGAREPRDLPARDRSRSQLVYRAVERADALLTRC